MIKVVFSEIEAPTSKEDATDCGRTSCVRAVNPTSKAQKLYVVNEDHKQVTLTVTGGESILIKKNISSTVYSSSKSVLISGVSIY